MTDEVEPLDDVSRRTVLKASAAGIGPLGMIVPVTGGDGASGSDDGGNDTENSEADPDARPDGEVVAQAADVIGQGPDGDVVAAEGATILRTPNELLVSVSMPRPEPGEYTYPSEPADREGEWWTDEVGEIEAFSLWAFVYNDPGACDGDCTSEDLGEPAGGGVYSVSGHAFGGPDLTLNGVISTDADLFEMDGEPMGVPLERPLDAEVHLAVAPHGAFDPDMLPAQLETPTNPGPDIWWIAVFDGG